VAAGYMYRPAPDTQITCPLRRRIEPFEMRPFLLAGPVRPHDAAIVLTVLRPVCVQMHQM
jgi:hypothetical protein